MATLADKINTSGIDDLIGQGGIEAHDLSDIKRQYESLVLESEIINADNVIEYWVEHSSEFNLQGNISIPNIAPVFPLIFFQAKIPSTNKARDMFRGGRSIGALIRVEADYNAPYLLEAYEEMKELLRKKGIGDEQVNKLRWAYTSEVVAENSRREIHWFPVAMIYFVGNDGTPLENRDGDAFSLPVSDFLGKWKSNGYCPAA